MLMLTDKQADDLRAAIELAGGSWDRAEGEDHPAESLDAIDTHLLHAQRDGDRIIMFAWHERHGHCSDCGLPAAFRLVGPRYQPDDEAWLRCSVCAANAAAEGEAIERLGIDHSH
jgi:hypothetical protein